MSFDLWASETCITCHIAFQFPLSMRGSLKETRKSFYCPNGHSMVYSGKSKAELEAEVSALKQRVAQRDDDLIAAQQQRDAAKAKADRIEKRAKAALCPCCNRHFENLARHLKTKHPEQNVVALKKAGTK